MRNNTRILLLGVLLGNAWADQVVMKDGDRISGVIVKKDGATLTIDSKNFGKVDLKWEDVETITIQEPVNVVLSGGRDIKGAVTTQDGRIVVGAPGNALPRHPRQRSGRGRRQAAARL